MRAMPNSIPTFLLFDSGIGGLSIADEIRRRIPDCRLFYVADNAFFPYGIQEESVLIQRLLELLPHLEQYARPDIIVIACNTASTVALDRLREQTRTPIIGVVPAIKPAAQLSKNHCIGLLATPGTIRRSYVQNLIDSFASHAQIIKVGSSELVQQAENKLRGQPVDTDSITRELQPFLQASPQPDTVVLGCTHFPFLREEILACLPPGCRLIDSGEAIARRAGALLEGITPSPTTLSSNEFLFTAATPSAEKLGNLLHLHRFSQVRMIANSITEIAQKHSAS